MSRQPSLGVLAIVATGCAASPRSEPSAPAQRERIVIVAAERGPQGARLVAIDERGDRQFDLLEVPDTIARDSHPALSPDGTWVVFASSRGRALDETSLWIARLEPNALPRRLTDGVGIESHPVWTPDGKAVVYASTREGNNFDLVRLAVVNGQAVGAPVALTSGEGHEVTPAIAADGTIAYTLVTPLAGGAVDSHIELRGTDGAITRLTEGPGDTSPALSPDGRTIAFSRPVVHEQGPDGDIWVMPRGAQSEAAPLIELPLTDESGPVWSPDGRYVFATSVLRGAKGNVVFSSVIVIDLRENPRHARLLQDRTGPIPRLTPAITRERLDQAALATDPEYLPELARIMASALAQQREQLSNPPPDRPDRP